MWLQEGASELLLKIIPSLQCSMAGSWGSWGLTTGLEHCVWRLLFASRGAAQSVLPRAWLSAACQEKGPVM